MSAFVLAITAICWSAAQAAGTQRDPVGMSYNSFLINAGEKLVLIDTATGRKLADSPYFRHHSDHGVLRLMHSPCTTPADWPLFATRAV
jgi:hypothetical protein